MASNNPVPVPAFQQLQALDTKVQKLSIQLDLISSWLVCEFGNKSNFPSEIKQLVHLSVEEFNDDCFKQFSETETTVKTARTSSYSSSELYDNNDHNFTVIIKPEHQHEQETNEFFIGPDSIDDDDDEFHNQQYPVPDCDADDDTLAEAEIHGNFAKKRKFNPSTAGPSIVGRGPEEPVLRVPLPVSIVTPSTTIQRQPQFRHIKPLPASVRPRPLPKELEYPCPLCPTPTVLKTLEKFQRHTAYFHPEPEANNPYKKFICPYCKISFTRKAALIRHMRLFICRITNTTNSNVEEEHQCDLCPSKFNSFNSLSVHRTRLHAGEIPYNCNLCPETFKRIDELKTHTDLVHPQYLDPNGGKKRKKRWQQNKSSSTAIPTPNACTFCPAVLNSIDELRQHTSSLHCGFDDDDEDEEQEVIIIN